MIAIAGGKCLANIEFASRFRKSVSPGGKGRRNSSTIINHFFNFLQTHQPATAHSSNGARERVHNISARALQFPRVHADAICGSVLCRKQRGCFQGAHTYTEQLSGGPQNWKDSQAGVALAARSPLWQGDEYRDYVCT